MCIPAPNYTQAPNALFDEWLPKLSFVELKVLMVIMRKTFGWHKIRDRISLSQLEELTGSRRTAIVKAAKNLEKCGLILKIKTGSNGSENSTYELVVIEDSNISDQSPKDTPPSLPGRPTKETLTKETKSPIVPKGDPAPRKKVREEKEEKAPEVFVSPTQHVDLLRRVSDDVILLQKSYEALSAWKFGKGIRGGRNDYKALIDWAIDAAKDKMSNPSKIDLKAQNKEWVNKLCTQSNIATEMEICPDYVNFRLGQAGDLTIKFTDGGFREQVLNRLRKMRITISNVPD